MASPWENDPDVTAGGGQSSTSAPPWADDTEVVDPFEGTSLARPKRFKLGSYLGGNALEGALQVPDIPASIEHMGHRAASYVNSLLLPHRIMPEGEEDKTFLPTFGLDTAAQRAGLLPNREMVAPDELTKMLGSGAKFAGGGAVLGLPKTIGALASEVPARGIGVASDLLGPILPAAKSVVGPALSNFASGMGAQAGEDYGPDWMPPELRQLAGASLGGRAGRGVINATSAQSRIPGISKPNEIVGAMDRLGVTPRLVGDVSGYAPFQGLQALSHETFGGGAVKDAIEQGQKDFATVTDRVANKYGNSYDLESGGKNVQGLARKWINDFLGKGDGATALPQGSMWDALWSLMPKSSSMSLPNWEHILNEGTKENPLMASILRKTQSTARDLREDYYNTVGKKTAQVLPPEGSPPMPTPPSGFARLGTRVGPEEGAGAFDPESGMSWTHPANQGAIPRAVGPQPAARGQTYTYDSTPATVVQVKDLHTQIGNLLGDPNLPADINKVFLKRAYGALTRDLETKAREIDAQRAQSPEGAWTVGPNGAPAPAMQTQQPSALAAFNAARRYTAQGHQFIDDVLKPFAQEGADGSAAMKSFLNETNRTGEYATAMRRLLPKAANEVAATKLRLGAKIDPAEPGEGSPPDFAKMYKNTSDGARRALFGQDQDIADMHTWANSTSGSSALRPGQVNKNLHLLTAAAASAGTGAAYGAEHGGVSGALLGGSVGLAAPFVLGKAGSAPLASPMVARSFGRTGLGVERPTLDIPIPGGTVRVPHTLPLSLSGRYVTPREEQR